MMRTVWKGAISFGLVSIPIKVVSATENHRVSFRQIHTADDGRIRYRKICEIEDREVPGEEVGKGYEAADGTLVHITDADLASLPLPTARTVDILGFVPVSSIDPYQLDRSYYLAPDSGAAKPYVLLREALRRGERGAIAKLAMRGRETLALVRALETDVLGMHTLLWPDEIRSADGIVPQEKVTVRDAELDLADTLMDSLGEVDLAGLHDEYRSAVDDLVSAKLAGTEPERPERPAAGGKVIDLMAALEDSVRTARESRGEGDTEAAEEDTEATVTPLKKKAAGKSTARKKSAKGDEDTEGEEEKPKGKTTGKGRKSPAKRTDTKKKAESSTSTGKKTSTKKKATGRKSAS